MKVEAMLKNGSNGKMDKKTSYILRQIEKWMIRQNDYIIRMLISI